MRCPSCHYEVASSARFCAQCGAPAPNRNADAELRQLSVLFCDLVGSTTLADTLDPEDLRDVTAEYHQVCADVIARFDGHVAQYLGDGVLVYFGYPAAHEDDARRAVRTALGLLEGIGTLGARLREERAISVGVRVGVHTGPVVVGEIGAARRENLALGRTPNLAARLQSLARPGTALISGDTHRIVCGFFELESLGTRELKGIAEPVSVYRVVRESGADSRLDAARRTGLTALTGRTQELAALDEAWRTVVARAEGLTILVRGEAGIGKSRLVALLRDGVHASGGSVLECSCAPDQQGSALQPIIASVGRSLGFDREMPDAAKRTALRQRLGRHGMDSPETVALLAHLLNITPPEEASPLDLPPAIQRERTLAALRGWLLAIAREGPTLFLLEDLHWADPTTLEFVGMIAQSPAARILTVLTFRSDFAMPLVEAPRVSTLSLERLGRDETAAMVSRVAAGKALPDDVVRQIVARTEGVPLFVEEVTKAVLEMGVLVAKDDRFVAAGPLPPDLIPATVQESLLARLDRLGSAKAIAQLAATIGREFRLDVLEAIATVNAEVVRGGVERLVAAELVYPVEAADATYLFKHALIQDAAYQSLLKKTRREQHHRTAETLQARFPRIVEQQPEVVARHFAAAGDADPAARLFLQAGQRALALAANHEAIAHLTSALAQLATLPESRPRDERELECNLALTPALQVTQGWASPGVDRAFRRSLELVERLGDTPHRLVVLASSFAFHVLRGHIAQALAIARQELELAEAAGQPGLLAVAHGSCCLAELYHGEIDAAIASGEAVLGLLTPEISAWITQATSLMPEVYVSCYLSEAAWMRGRLDRALDLSARSVTVAREANHAPSVEFATGYQAEFLHLRREPRAILAVADDTMRLSEERGSAFWNPMITAYRGWALNALGETGDGIELIRDGLTRYRQAGNGLTQVHLLALLAEALARARRDDEALEALAEADEISAATGERYFLPEIHRLRAELQRTAARGEAADANARRALTMAREQGATSLALRAAMTLCRVQRDRGAAADGRDALRELVALFPKDVEAADLLDARGLLAEIQATGGAQPA